MGCWILLGLPFLVILSFLIVAILIPIKNEGLVPVVRKTKAPGEELTEPESALARSMECPDCHSSLRDGPCGGLSVNVHCVNPSCGSRFNDMGPFGIERITRASPNSPEAAEPPE